jgi:hypothetical protein
MTIIGLMDSTSEAHMQSLEEFFIFYSKNNFCTSFRINSITCKDNLRDSELLTDERTLGFRLTVRGVESAHNMTMYMWTLASWMQCAK